jgi:hypothetical protein
MFHGERGRRHLFTSGNTALAAQVPEHHARVVVQHAVAQPGLGLGPDRHQGLGMGTVPLAEQDDEHILMGSARVDASQIVQARHIVMMALYCGQHAHGHQ